MSPSEGTADLYLATYGSRGISPGLLRSLQAMRDYG